MVKDVPRFDLDDRTLELPALEGEFDVELETLASSVRVESPRSSLLDGLGGPAFGD